ncbi:MAG TPA: hypothetical protein VH951_00570 [Dehalococcoidia bacterium]|jgi:hypothetical protein
MQKLAFALFFAAMAFAAATGISEAAKGPDARDVQIFTIIGVAIAMAVLGLLYMLKIALGGASTLPPEEPGAGGHH